MEEKSFSIAIREIHENGKALYQRKLITTDLYRSSPTPKDAQPTADFT